ncbi:uncharacterized protein LOC125041621 [Penaeus chinensis]|uniref:uncharacterized protein LOC125041621 n=1 Tax=Penaeus chinensis TaxID=139456 RepID=UPI001FB736C1|nr:uncharacterized protein LOC125041621 [Penaeus chinensis]
MILLQEISTATRSRGKAPTLRADITCNSLTVGGLSSSTTPTALATIPPSASRARRSFLLVLLKGWVRATKAVLDLTRASHRAVQGLTRASRRVVQDLTRVSHRAVQDRNWGSLTFPLLNKPLCSFELIMSCDLLLSEIAVILYLLGSSGHMHLPKPSSASYSSASEWLLFARLCMIHVR